MLRLPKLLAGFCKERGSCRLVSYDIDDIADNICRHFVGSNKTKHAGSNSILI